MQTASSLHLSRSCLITISLAFFVSYGVLYAIHAGRSASDQVDELESQVSELEYKINNLESEIESLEYRGFSQ